MKNPNLPKAHFFHLPFNKNLITKDIGSMNSIRLFLLSSFISFAFCFAQEKRPSIAVMDFEARGGISQTDASTFADRFRFELMQTDSFEVMERAQMNLILQEQNFQRSDCVDQQCAVEAGRLIAVKKIVSGSVAKVGGIYTINAKLLDVETGKIDKNLSQDCDCPIEKVLVESLRQLALKMVGLAAQEQKTTVTIQRGDASLFVKSVPADASIYIDGKLADGRTPVMIENLTPGTHRIQVKKADMQASADVQLVGNKVVTVSLKLEMLKTALKITTTPFDAEVYLDNKRSLSRYPSRITPAIFYDISPGVHKVSLFKVGYADTAFPVMVKEYESSEFSLNLLPITDEKQILSQKKFVKHRSFRKIGRFMIGGSLLLAAGGGVLMWLAQRDYDDALTAKNTLEQSSISGPDYDKWKKENEDKSNAGNTKTWISIGLFGTMAALGGVGIVLYF